MNLTLRVLGDNPKLSPLTHDEIDDNFLEVSASIAEVSAKSLVTASLSADVLRFEKGDGSTFDIDFTEFVIEPETGSLYLGSSFDDVSQIITFIKGNGTTDLVDLSSFVTEAESGSLVYSASFDANANIFTFHRHHGDYDINISRLSGLTLYEVEASGSFSGSFEGDGSGLTGVGLDHTIEGGLGVRSFLFDGSSDEIVTVDTGSAHFTEGVRKKITGSPTGGPGGIEVHYDPIPGEITANIVTPNIIVGNTNLDLGNTYPALDGVQLTNVEATGSFTGSFEGDFILSKAVSSGKGIDPFSFNGLSDQVVGVATASAHFTEGARRTITGLSTTGPAGIDVNYDSGTGEILSTLVNSSITIGTSGLDLGGSYSTIDGVQLTDVEATGSFTGSFAGDFILSKAVSAGKGIESFNFDGLADQDVNIDTGSAHFTEGVRKKIGAADTTGPSGIDMSYDAATGLVSGSLINSSITIGTSGLDLGSTNSRLDGVQLTDVEATGSFTGSFAGDFILSKTLSSGDGIKSFSFDGLADQDVSVDTGSLHFTGGVKKKLNTEAVVSSSAQVVAHLPAGTVSGSSQITITESQISDLVHYTDTDVKNKMNLDNVVSGSLTSLLPSGVVSGSQQVVDHLPAGTVSSSQQITITESQISDLVHYTDADVKAKMNLDGVLSGSLTSILPSGVVSGSQQVVDHLPSGTVSGSQQITITESQISDLTHYTDADVKAKMNLDNVISGSVSGQVDHDATSNFVANEHIDHSSVSITAGDGLDGGGDITATRTLSVNTGSLHFTDGVKEKLDAEGVVSGSINQYTDSDTLTYINSINVISGSIGVSSTSQGTFSHSAMGTTTAVDLGLETTDDVKFASTYSGTGTKDSSAILQADSTTQGLLPPRMTETQRINISSPATGLVVYQTDGSITITTPFGNQVIDNRGLWYYDGTDWIGPLSI